ncbi:hypothetical protein ACTXT7_010969 [Hymenolepis weldensis]
MISGLKGTTANPGDIIVVGLKEKELKRRIECLPERNTSYGFHLRPKKCFRQIQRQSQRRYLPKANGQPARYIPPPELRQAMYCQNGTTDSPFTYSRRFEDLSASVKQQQQEREFSFSHIDNSYQRSALTSMASPIIPHTYNDDSRYVCVSLDYVPDRGRMLWSRWILIMLCLCQLISAFAVIGCHAIDFSEDTKLEVGVSLGLLLESEAPMHREPPFNAYFLAHV